MATKQNTKNPGSVAALTDVKVYREHGSGKRELLFSSADHAANVNVKRKADGLPDLTDQEHMNAAVEFAKTHDWNNDYATVIYDSNGQRVERGV